MLSSGIHKAWGDCHYSRNIDEALENALLGIWSHFCDLMPTMTCKTPLAGVFPSHLRFLEAPEGKA